MNNSEPHATVVALLRGDGTLVKNNDEIQEKESFFRVIIDVGEEDEIYKNSRVVIYAYGDEIVHPLTGESLGLFEIVRGEGTIVQSQSRMSVVRSDRKATEMRRKPSALNALALGGAEMFEPVQVAAPFAGAMIGDNVRFI